MFFEHILYSVAIAIIVGVLYESIFKSTLPIWIIAACAWLPDIDYVLQTITFQLYHITQFIIIHGTFHNIFWLLIFSFGIAYILKKYKNMNFNKVFLCMVIGCTTHMFCDYFVYDMVFNPLYPIYCVVWGCPLISEFGSFYGIGEFSLIVWGLIFVVVALTIKVAFDIFKEWKFIVSPTL
jgi:membrane-bound metal-dependent hydrolase YbcI (DUF457 family)